jgi:hypothetical protein
MSGSISSRTPDSALRSKGSNSKSTQRAASSRTELKGKNSARHIVQDQWLVGSLAYSMSESR